MMKKILAIMISFTTLITLPQGLCSASESVNLSLEEQEDAEKKEQMATLAPGDHSEDVIKLQEELIMLGFLDDAADDGTETSLRKQ